MTAAAGQAGRRRAGPGTAFAAAALVCLPAAAAAQTDYYNLDRNRPLRVEDAYAVERYAFEAQLSPLTLEGASGALVYAPSVELKFGLLPGMEVAAGLEPVVRRVDGSTSASAGTLELTTLYQLNSETLGIPALGVRLTGHVPLEGGGDPSLEAVGILTRVLGGSWRAHLNGAAIAGEHTPERWWAGLAVDFVLPFHSLLLLTETYYSSVREDAASGGAQRGRVHSAVGLRYQLTPRTGVDLGAGGDWTGPGPTGWRATFGVTTAMGFRALMP